MSVDDLRTMGRATQGVKLINLKDSDSIAAVAKVMKDEDNLDEVEIRDIDVKTEDGTAIDTNDTEKENE
jgi:DNA gyrase subunit A